MTNNSNNKAKGYKNPFIWGIIILSVLAGSFFAVMFFDTTVESAGSLLGITGDPNNTKKNDILRFIGIAMGGIIILLQALASYRRAKAMEDAAKAQAVAAKAQAEGAKAQAEGAKAQAEGAKAQAEANQNTERGQQQERLKNAIEHLGHKSDSVRLGGAYELFHLAQDNRELNQTVLDILCAHIRQTTNEKKYQNHYSLEPSEEIQGLLTLLFAREHEVFSGCHINLQASWLKGAELSRARLTKC